MFGWRPNRAQVVGPPLVERAVGDTAEPLHERALAEQIAFVRLVLTGVNFAVIRLDSSLPSAGTAQAYAWAYAAAALFLVYALFVWVALRRQRISLTHYLRLSPVVDVLCAALLIIVTDGYLSPFNLWLVFAVVSSGFSRYRRLPLFTAALALLAHSLIATIPQEHPPDYSVFAVRTAYLFGFAAVLALISSSLVGQSRALATIEDTAAQLGETRTREAAGGVLLTRLTDALHLDGATLAFPDGTSLAPGMPPVTRQPTTATWNLEIAGQTLASLTVYRKTPLTRQEETTARVLSERTASALLRIRLSERLAEAAIAAERAKVADELHDTCLQTLAALDLRAEAARRLTGDGHGAELLGELMVIKQLTRNAAAQVREIAHAHADPAAAGPALVRELMATRWPGQASVEIAPDVNLAEAQWRAVEMLVKEGLNNAKKHAGAQRVSLRLVRCADRKIVCSLENDGAPPQGQPAHGYGLSRLRAVVEQEGGQLALVPGPAGGALLQATFGEASCQRSVS
jgi:signal transduction histidine kinase